MLSQSSWMDYLGKMPVNTTILVVEDHAMVRECLRELLAEGGRVSDAADAPEALECMTVNQRGHETQK